MTYTPTQARLINILNDGQRHTKEELMASCPGGMSLNTLQVHLSYLRQKLPNGLVILCEFHNRRNYYRLVRLVHYPE